MKTLRFTKRTPALEFLLIFIVGISIVFSVASILQAQAVGVPCDSAALISAIVTANGSPAPDTLDLTAGCTYSFNTVNNTSDGPNALPSISGQLTINGNGATITRGGGTLRFFHVQNGATLTLNNMTITNGSVTGALEDRARGGAVFNRGTLNTVGVTFRANTAAYTGGAIHNYGTTNVAATYFDSNRTTFADGTRFSAGAGISQDGGGTVINVNHSSFVNNISEGWAQYTGGGGIINYSGTVNVSNTTFYDNFSAREGGAMAQYTSGTATFTNITVVNNGGVTNGGGIVIIAGSSTFRNSIIANNYLSESTFNTILPQSVTWGIVWPATFDPNAGIDIDGIMNSQGYNIVTTHTKKLPFGFNTHYPHPTDIGPGINPQVGALTGGTHLPLSLGGIAVDRIPLANCSATDQLGQPRMASSGMGAALCDIGAFEYQPPIPPTATPTETSTPTSTPTPGPSATPTDPASVDRNVTFCADLDGSVHEVVRVSTVGVAWGIHCRIIAANETYMRTSAEVGVQAVLDMGVIHAVDVFNAGDAPFPPQFSVCLAGVGDLVFLDAAGIPRVPQPMVSFAYNGFTCGNVTTDGTLVLVHTSGMTVAPPPAIATLTPSSFLLNGCRVTTTNILNLRAEPNANGAVIAQVPYNLTLTATERSGEWIRVIFESGQGWLNAGYLQLEGLCG